MSRELQIDEEFKNLIPPLSADEFSRLEKSILAEGVREPIITWNDTIVDGNNRYKICQKHALVCPRREMEFPSRDDAKLFIISNQLSRRNLPVAAIGLLKLEEKEIVARQAKERQRAAGGDHGNQYTGGKLAVTPNLGEAADKGETLEILAQDIPLGKESLRKLDVINRKAKEGNETAIRVRDELQSGEKKSIHGGYVSVVGKPKPRKPSDMLTEDGRIICVMCGEPISEGDAHAARPTVHKKCEQEYQRDWDKDRRSGTQRAKHEKPLEGNTAVYDVKTLVLELNGNAKVLGDAWKSCVETYELMGVCISKSDRDRLFAAIDGLYAAVQRIKL